MAQKFIENGHEVMAVDRNEERADAAVGLIQQILIGDATDERFMESLGISNFDLAVVAVGENFQTVLEITVLLKDLGCKYIVARATRDVHKKLLLRNGADYVTYAEREVAERLAIKFGADNIFDYVELTRRSASMRLPFRRSGWAKAWWSCPSATNTMSVFLPPGSRTGFFRCLIPPMCLRRTRALWSWELRRTSEASPDSRGRYFSVFLSSPVSSDFCGIPWGICRKPF